MATVSLTKENFETEVKSQNEVVLIDFWASWCGPCKMLSPIIDQVEKEVGPDVKVCKVNIDEQPELASQFNIMSVPTLIVMKNGEAIHRSVGVIPKAEILSMLGK